MQNRWDGPSIRSARYARGWSQKILARKLKASCKDLGMEIPELTSVVTTISNWENGRNNPSDEYQMLLIAALGERPIPVLESKAYKELLVLPDVESSTTAGRLQAELELAFSLESRDLEQLVSATEELRLLDRHGNMPKTIATMERHINSLERFFNASVEPLARLSLAGTLADAEAIAGWAALDRGLALDSWNHLGAAMNAALFAENRSLVAFASAQRAYVLIDLRQFDSAQNLVAAVLQKCRRNVPSELAAWLYGAQAEAAAANGNVDLCKKSLDLGRARLSYRSSSDECPYVVLDELHFERWAGSCLAKLGDREAIDSLERVRDEMHPDFARALGGVLVDLTQAYVVQREIDAAARVFSAACHVTGGVGSIRQINRLRELRKEWPSRLIL